VTRALVTGAAGFIGANLVRRLVDDGHDVHMIVRPDSRDWRIEALPDGARLHEVDLEDREGVEKAVRAAQPEWIFHLAARGAYSWQADAGEILRTNVIGTANLLEAAVDAGFAAFVYSGTSSEYGLKDHAPSEDEPVEPNSAYAVGKASGTMLCRLFARSSARRVVVLRLYSVFGPWEEPGRLLPSLVLRGLAGELPPLVSPDVSHDFVYVDDVIDAFLRAARGDHVEPGAIFNVGSGVQTTIADAVAVARRVLAIEAEPQWGTMPSRAWDTSVWIADAGRIERELGWKTAHTFEEGFRKQADWFRANERLWPFYEELAKRRIASRSRTTSRGSSEGAR
jgi:nucleoside-diphosphate-sugar epimerase